MQFKVDWSSTFKPDKLDLDMLERGRAAMIRVTTAIRHRWQQKLQVRKAPGAGLGGRFTGAYASRITPTVTMSHTEITGEVRAGVPYAKYVEGWNSLNQHVPVRRHYVPFDVAPMLRVWAIRHGILKKTSKALGMMVGGPESITPAAEPTFLEILPSAREILAGSITPNG